MGKESTEDVMWIGRQDSPALMCISTCRCLTCMSSEYYIYILYIYILFCIALLGCTRK